MTTTAATAALSPGSSFGSGLGATADDTEIITWADFKQWERQLASTGTCSHPIRLTGRIEAIDRATGETAPVYDTAAEPGGVLHVACGNRRESVCPACSAVYKRDARQLVRAGLAGGKGIPETITGHPCVFATLTAPPFGPVHSRRMRGKTVLPCRPRRDAHARRCAHGHDISCPTRHMDEDPRLGQPLCFDCYDYEAAVLFNAYATCGAGSPPTCPASSHNKSVSAPGEALSHARLHDLRHLHATTLLLAGVPVHVVAARLGHADPAVTLRVYAHVLREHALGIGDVFAQAVKAPVSKSASKPGQRK